MSIFKGKKYVTIFLVIVLILQSYIIISKNIEEKKSEEIDVANFTVKLVTYFNLLENIEEKGTMEDIYNLYSGFSRLDAIVSLHSNDLSLMSPTYFQLYADMFRRILIKGEISDKAKDNIDLILHDLRDLPTRVYDNDKKGVKIDSYEELGRILNEMLGEPWNEIMIDERNIKDI